VAAGEDPPPPGERPPEPPGGLPPPAQVDAGEESARDAAPGPALNPRADAAAPPDERREAVADAGTEGEGPPDDRDGAAPAADAAAPLPGRARGLLLHLPLDDASGSTAAKDRSGHGRDGVLRGFDPDVAWVAGRHGGALRFLGGGSGGWVEVGGVPALDRSGAGFSVAAWFRSPPDFINDGVFLSSGAPGPVATRHELRISDGQLMLRIDPADSPRLELFGGQALPIGQWVHVAATFDGARAVVYVDGRPVAQQAYARPTGADPSRLLVGGRPGAPPDSVAERLTGRLDEVMVYERALSPAEIAALATGAAADDP
jgi:hypothetical protein